MSRGDLSRKASLGANGTLVRSSFLDIYRFLSTSGQNLIFFLQVLTDHWHPTCSDLDLFSQYALAYKLYLQYLIKTFKPKYLCMGVEISAHITECGTTNWNQTVKAYNVRTIQIHFFVLCKATSGSRSIFQLRNALGCIRWGQTNSIRVRLQYRTISFIHIE